jgi:hypothetical protein
MALKATIRDDYAAECWEELPYPSMTITLAASLKHAGDWDIQTGDNSYSGVAYGYTYWAVEVLTRRSNTRELARQLIEELADQWYSSN